MDDLYMGIKEADALVEEYISEGDPEYTAWMDLDEKEKKILIFNGGKLINSLPFLGIKYYSTSSIVWPRLIRGFYKECPVEIKLAIIKQALREKINKTAGSGESKLQELGVKTYTIKNASITFADKPSYLKLSNGIYSDIYETYIKSWIY